MRFLRADYNIEVVTLDTAACFQKPMRCGRETEARYGRRIRGFYPDAARIETSGRPAGHRWLLSRIEAPQGVLRAFARSNR